MLTAFLLLLGNCPRLIRDGKERQITTRFHLHVESKKGGRVEPKLIKTEIRFAVSRGERWGLGELNQGIQKVNISTCKINEHWDYSIQHEDCSQCCCVVYLKIGKRVSPKSLCHKKKNPFLFLFLYLCETMDVKLLIIIL